MKALIYARVSSKEQEETGYSLPAQEKFLREYAERKDYEIAKAFAISESASGMKQRQVFGEMLRFAIKHDIKIVICEKVDRLTRNFKDAVAIDEWLEEDEERQLHLVKDSLVLHRNSRSQEKLNWGIRIIFAKNYIDNLSEEVKKGLDEKLRQGWLPTKPPPGYKTIGEKGHKTHIIDETTAPIVRKLFELYATGDQSLKTVTEFVYQAGLRNSGGKRIYKSRIAVMLGNPFYVGKIRYRGIVYPGAHEPLIDDELFNKVQQVLRGKTTPRYRKHFPLFKALLRCAECGGTITWEIQKGHWYGHCNKYKNCTQKKFVRQEEVEAQLIPYLEAVQIKSPRLAEWIKKALKESHQDEQSFKAVATEELRKRHETAEKRLHALYDDKLDGKIPETFYKQKYEQYTKEREEALAAIKAHDTADNRYLELGANVIDLAQRAKDIYLHENRTMEERRQLMSLVFSNLTLKASDLNASYSKPFQILSGYVPGWNQKFEPTTTSGKSADLTFAGTKTISLLRRQDSNLEPSPYT